MPFTLILLRHGQSTWNEKNLFTGWEDVDITEAGRKEAVRAGDLLKQHNYLPDVCHTSLLRRAITTGNVALDAADRHWIPIKKNWMLNERHYGALQGLNKQTTAEKYGDDQVKIWRRSYDVRPPQMSDGAYERQQQYARTQDRSMKSPGAEALKDVVTRLEVYWKTHLVPDLQAGQTVLVAAHGNSLRALVKMLDGLGDEEVVELNIPTGIPIVYELDDALRPLSHGGQSAPLGRLSNCVALAGTIQSKHGVLQRHERTLDSHVGGRFYDDESVWPVFARPQSLDVSVYIHPTSASDSMEAHYRGNYPDAVAVAISVSGWGWHGETGGHILRPLRLKCSTGSRG